MFINFCQIKDLTYSEQLLMDAYEIIQPYMDQNIDKAYKADQYGIANKGQVYWDDASDYRYLVLYMFIIRMRIIRDFQSCNLQTYEYYKDQFKLECIKKHFSCKTITFNVDNLFALFGITTTTFGFEGIDFAALEIDDEPVCNEQTIFEVQSNYP